jgi:FkbM family methyltransferase
VSRKPVTLVQVGANDGTLLSAPIRRFGWTGILIEPVPFIFEMLKSNYADVSGLVLLNIAIHAQDDGGKVPFYSVKQLDNPPNIWYNQLSSFKKEVLLSHSIQIPHLDDLIEEIQISTRTFAGIIMEFKIKNVTIFVRRL